jgi:hypothetical protein
MIEPDLDACVRVQVKLLVEEGGATVDLEDRWKHTALDEAKQVRGFRAGVQGLTP